MSLHILLVKKSSGSWRSPTRQPAKMACYRLTITASPLSSRRSTMLSDISTTMGPQGCNAVPISTDWRNGASPFADSNFDHPCLAPRTCLPPTSATRPHGLYYLAFTARNGTNPKHNSFFRGDYKPAVKHAGLPQNLRFHPLPTPRGT